MQGQAKTGSSLSADSTQIRYQKALKEINKLIILNTDLREEINTKNQKINDLESKLKSKDEHLNNILAQRNQLQADLINTVSERTNIFQENQSLRKQMGRMKSLNGSDDSRLKKIQTKDSIFSASDLYKVADLERILEEKDQAIKELNRKLTISSEVSRSYGKQSQPKIQKGFAYQDLEKRLKISEQYIEKLSEQCAQYKVKLSRSQMLSTVKSVQRLSRPNIQILHGSPRNSYLSNIQTKNSEEVLIRYHKLEEQNKKLVKKNEHLKHQMQKIHHNHNKLQRQYKNVKSQATGFGQLAKKQQQIIDNLHKDFSQQIMKMTQQFKQKINEQRESFSPGKQAQNLKTIQSLQIENKSMKKKVQLCAVQMTKCFKTLQVYKAKLAEVQQQYGKVLNERDELQDRLNNHRRDRSTHSRGSASKIDNDRRNSMGTTRAFMPA